MVRRFTVAGVLLCSVVLLACPPHDTALRIRVNYDPSWGISELAISAGARTSRVRAAREVYLLPPDDAVGRPLELRVVGFRGAVRFASGRVAPTPRRGEVVEAEVSLARLPCGAWCTMGATRCEADVVVVCTRDAVGCVAWQPFEVCGAGTTCSQGLCRADCIDECAPGEHSCEGPSSQRTCRTDGDADPCADWVTTDCPEASTCSGGQCREACTSECAIGSVRCDLGGLERCGDEDDDGCREWGPRTPCPGVSVCHSGACIDDAACEDECSGADCVEGRFTVCGQFDLDPCRERSLGSLCASEDPCFAGRCTAAGCAQIPQTGPACDDGDATTMGERCVAGRCLVANLDAGADASLSDAGRPDTGAASDADMNLDARTSPPLDGGADAPLQDTGRDAPSMQDAWRSSDPCGPHSAGLTLTTRMDSASAGTPDTYSFPVTPGAPFCATISGSGGPWTVVVSSRGTRLCDSDATCVTTVPSGSSTMNVTAVTPDIGYYTLRVYSR